MSRFSFFGLPLSIVLLWGLIFAGSLVLPSANAGVFASPDETAVAVSLERIQETGRATVEEPLARQAPWLHPRSYLAVGTTLVPVGFLGWPWWLAQLHRLIPLVPLAWVASLFAASGVIPWYLLLRKRFGLSAAWWGTLLAWTFPPVLLYVNRSLFSHLPQYSAVLWAAWILVVIQTGQRKDGQRTLLQIVAGVLFGTALSFRPMEAIWLVPIFVLLWSQFGGIQWRKQLFLFLGTLLGLLPLFVVQAQTYGSWFQIGYWIQANSDPSAMVIPQLATAAPRAWYLAFAPYGLHPRNSLWNVRSFFLSFLWPSALVFGLALLYRVQQFLKEWKRGAAFRCTSRHIVSLLVVGAVVGWLLLIYGSGLYADHVRPGAVTVANSFLRYTIPFGFFLAWFLASIRSRLKERPHWQRLVYAAALLFIAVFGAYTAFARDEEGILATRRELKRYATIRSAALATFTPGSIILSERSDKIFFPQLRVISPLPSFDQAQALAALASSSSIGLFSRPLSLLERDAWRKIGYDVRELQAFDRERLYRLTPFLR